jgi:hypothetical protein
VVIGLTGEAGNGATQITREIGKNQVPNVQQLFDQATVLGWFTTSDPNCPLTNFDYQLRVDAATVLTDRGKGSNAVLFNRLVAGTYNDDGNVQIDTQVDAGVVSFVVQDFYVAVLNGNTVSTLTPPIRVTINCKNVNSITSAFNTAQTNSNVYPWNVENFKFAIFVPNFDIAEVIF